MFDIHCGRDVDDVDDEYWRLTMEVIAIQFVAMYVVVVVVEIEIETDFSVLET
jgi:hypothetical protein